MVKSGIYSIINKINNKIYVGSSKNIMNRKSQHYSELRGGYHENIFLQRAWNKYGEENFEFKILEIVNNLEDLLYIEQKYIDKYFDNCKNCYNINSKATLPPTFSKKCIIYDKNGDLIKQFNSVKECCEFMNIPSITVKDKINCNSLIKGQYRFKLIDESGIIEKIETYKPINYKEIYLLNDKDHINKTFYSISEVGEYFNEKLSCITQCLQLIHKYKNFKIIYKDDYEKFKCYPKFSTVMYKYILKYDFKGNLISVIENKYGLKFSSSENDNCKINTRLLLLGRNSPLRIYHKKYVYIKSNSISNTIKTNIKIYYIKNVENDTIHEFLTVKDLCSFLNISKGKYEYYSNKDLILDNKYKIYTTIY